MLVQSEPEVESQGCSEVDDGGQVGEVRALRDQGCHRRSECRKLKAEQAAMARSTPSSSTSAADGELTAKKRKRDIAALEKQLAELKQECRTVKALRMLSLISR